jgi:hypothetical protein
MTHKSLGQTVYLLSTPIKSEDSILSTMIKYGEKNEH